MEKSQHSKKENDVRANSDGCTLAPDFGFRFCCVDHDVSYSNITSDNVSFINNFSTRKDADIKLKNCIKKAVKNKQFWKKPLPYIYYGFVRTFGWLFYNYKNNG